MGKGSTKAPAKVGKSFQAETGPMALFLLVGANAMPKPAALQPAKQMNDRGPTLDIEVRALAQTTAHPEPCADQAQASDPLCGPGPCPTRPDPRTTHSR